MTEIQARIQSPGDLLRKLLSEKKWTQEDLAGIINRSRQSVSDIISGRSGITPETAISLAAAFGNKPMDWWLLEGEYRITQLEPSTTEIGKRSTILDIAPIRDMQKRGWLSQGASLNETEQELKMFFGTDDLDSDFNIPISYHRNLKQPQLNKSEKAWTMRAINLAKMLPVPAYQEAKLESLQKALRNTAAKSLTNLVGTFI